MTTHPGPEALIPALLAAGYLSPSAAVRGDVELVPVGRSHPVFQVLLDGRPRAAVKLFGPRRGETDGEAARELAVRALAAEVPELARLLPPMLRPERSVDGMLPDGLVVTGWFDGVPAWEDDALSQGEGDPAADLVGLAQRVAGPLAAMHRATGRRAHAGALPPALAGPCPWGLRLFDGDAPAELWRHPAVAAVLARAGEDRAIVAGVRRARGAWRAVALVHGDLKHDNVLLAPDGRLALVDWEMARLGDPAWDLAGLLLRPLLAPDGGGWSDANHAAAVRLLGCYARSRATLRPLAQRLVLYVGAWVLMSLLQYHSVATAPDEEGTARLLAVARSCAFDGAHLVASLLEASDVR
jgi:hypothetical protein